MRRTILAVTVVCAACNQLPANNAELAELKRTLGDVQYISLDPQLSMTVQQATFEPAETRADSPTAKYTITIKQNNQAFPLAVYNINGSASVVDGNGNVIDTITFFGRVENGVLSIAGVDEMYGSDRLVTPMTAPSLRLRIDRYDWSPIRGFTPYLPPSSER